MPGTFSLIRKNYSLIPLLVLVGTGVAAATAYTARVALYHPEVNWKRDGPKYQYYEKSPYRKLWWYFDNTSETS